MTVSQAPSHPSHHDDASDSQRRMSPPALLERKCCLTPRQPWANAGLARPSRPLSGGAVGPEPRSRPPGVHESCCGAATSLFGKMWFRRNALSKVLRASQKNLPLFRSSATSKSVAGVINHRKEANCANCRAIRQQPIQFVFNSQFRRTFSSPAQNKIVPYNLSDIGEGITGGNTFHMIRCFSILIFQLTHDRSRSTAVVYQGRRQDQSLRSYMRGSER